MDSAAVGAIKPSSGTRGVVSLDGCAAAVRLGRTTSDYCYFLLIMEHQLLRWNMELSLRERIKVCSQLWDLYWEVNRKSGSCAGHLNPEKGSA